MSEDVALTRLANMNDFRVLYEQLAHSCTIDTWASVVSLGSFGP